LLDVASMTPSGCDRKHISVVGTRRVVDKLAA
jgi:hypothetical protein